MTKQPRRRRAVFTVAAILFLASACGDTNDGLQSEPTDARTETTEPMSGGVDEDFEEDRDTATVWLISPTPFSEDDGQVQLDLIAETFDWPHTTPVEDTYLTGPVGGTGWNVRGHVSPTGKGSVTISNLDNRWSFSIDEYEDDPFCRRCSPLPFDGEEAKSRTEELLEQLGLDRASFDVRAQPSVDGRERTVRVRITAGLMAGGLVTDLEWIFDYRNDDGTLAAASGHFVTVSELGDVPILTPEEALTLAGHEATEEAVAGAELTLETHIDRDTNQGLLIPVYSVPVLDPDNLGVTIPATRRQDIPNPEGEN